ncbi:MAG: hypothetical protein ACRDT4_20475 [Micromonosporaceae bacterium]
MRSAARTPRVLLVFAALTLLGAATPGSVSAATGPGVASAPGHDRLVRTYPGSVTPNIADGRVYAIADLGSKVVVGGTFTQVASKGSSTLLSRRYAFAFDKATGVVDANFRPALDGEVRTLLPGPSGQVFLGGRFTTLNGAARRGLALVSTGTGARIGTFNPPALNGPVYDLASHPNGTLLIGGTFTKLGAAARGGLASVNRVSGALDSFLTVALAGHHNYDGDGAIASVGVTRFALAPGGGQLAVVGNFRTADGQDRDQAAVITTTGTKALVSGWRTDGFRSACNSNSFDTWVRDVAYAPDGSYFVVVATGGPYPGTLCDTASRWPVGAGLQTPTWVAATGGDTLLSVAATEQAVYVGGHIRWLNNPLGKDAARPGAVGRASIAALDPATGLPYGWNPGRNPRGFGVTELYATAEGLWLGYDTGYLGNYQWRRERIGFFPLAGGAAVPAQTSSGLPGPVYVAGPGTSSALVRRRYHGPGEVGQDESAPEAGMDWSAVRGAFWVGGTLYYGRGDGNLYRRGYDGFGWESASVVDPYHDNDGVAPDWDTVSHGKNGTYAGAYPDFYGTELAMVTGMGYAAGRLYYTVLGSGALYWRWFTPSTGTVGAQRFQVTGSGFGDVAGALFVTGGQLYVSRLNGALYRIPFAGGAPSGVPVQVSGPGVDGHTWRARAIFPAP